MKMHAGEMLKMQFNERMPGKMNSDFAERIGIGCLELTAIFLGRQRISAEISRKFDEVFDTGDPEFWMRVQNTCDKRNAKITARRFGAEMERD